MKLAIPKWVLTWFAFSTLIIFYDVSFVWLRPDCFLWEPYLKYVQVDLSYADLGNAFVKTQALMSLIEVFIGWVGVLNHSVLLLFSSQLLTLMKTVLILSMEVIGGFAQTGHNSFTDTVLLYWLPNAIWVMVPFMVCWVLGRRIAGTNAERA